MKMTLNIEFDGKTIADVVKAMRDGADSLEGSAGKKGTKSKPEPTVSDEEDESFGKKPLSKKELKAKKAAEEDEDEADEEDESDEAEDEADEDDSEDDEESDEEDETGVSWDELKAAINKYGEKKPEDMKAIMLSFKCKSTKELKMKAGVWEACYRKLMAKLKSSKKGS